MLSTSSFDIVIATNIFFRSLEDVCKAECYSKYLFYSLPVFLELSKVAFCTTMQIVFVSTPNKVGDIMHKISLEKDSLWTKLYFDYRVAVGHMWTPEEVEQMKKSSAFEKEYNLKFGYGTSTIFNVHDIDFITSDQYDTSEETCTSHYFTKWLAIDPGWGGSNSFGI
jgi:hypothetical protein